jgi:hypothetical protein
MSGDEIELTVLIVFWYVYLFAWALYLGHQLGRRHRRRL